jgi:HTH-type transcriptional regulator/antitoxin HipB
MRSFRQHLKEKLKDERFGQLYEEEKQLAELSLKILDIREHLGLSQTEVARKARVTQQQLSKIENGVNCNIATFLKVCNALGIKFDIETPRLSHLGRRTFAISK